jgi:probable rRNA maturation factor
MGPPLGTTSLPAKPDAPADPEPPSLCLTVINEDGDWTGIASVKLAIRGAATALANHPAGSAARGSEATVVLGSDTMLRDLNRTYRGQDTATNVLSFPFTPHGAGDTADGLYLGDVLLAVETICREAAERRIDPAHHVQHLVIHGLLHLLGYDHETELQAAEMEGLETEVLAGLGIQDPYALDPRSGH